jgi:hypothetical protein
LSGTENYDDKLLPVTGANQLRAFGRVDDVVSSVDDVVSSGLSVHRPLLTNYGGIADQNKLQIRTFRRFLWMLRQEEH